jgi:hypothetical protein
MMGVAADDSSSARSGSSSAAGSASAASTVSVTSGSSTWMPKWRRARLATSSSTELEWVFFSVTPN